MKTNSKQSDFSMGNMTFLEAGLSSFLSKVYQHAGYSAPTPIQFYSIKEATHTQESIVCRSKSGTGKTLAYFSIILSMLATLPKNEKTFAIIVLPTRELAMQVYQIYKHIQESINQTKATNEEQSNKKGILKNCNAQLTMGGVDFEEDRKKYRQDPPRIVVSTVGRMYQLILQKIIKIDPQRSILVLDEGDKLFGNEDSKFEKILKSVPTNSRWLAYSATYTKQILKKIHTFKKFKFIQTTSSSKQHSLNVHITSNLMEQLSENSSVVQQLKGENIQGIFGEDANLLDNIHKFIYVIPTPSTSSLMETKLTHLSGILQELTYHKCLIFVTKKAFLQEISHFLDKYDPLLIHGGMSQAQRFRVMNRMNDPQVKIILTSDLLARGIDIFIDLVVLFDVGDHATFWHRIGRTGRYGRTGVVVTLQQTKSAKDTGKNIEGIQGNNGYWETYKAQEVNKYLKQSRVSLGVQKGQIDKNEDQNKNTENETKTKKNCWYGSHLTEISRWVDVDPDQEVQNNYRYYVPKIDKTKEKEQKISEIRSKQSVEEMMKNFSVEESELMLPKFKNQGELHSYIQQNIFGCLECINFMEDVSQLTGYQFQIMKYCIPDKQ